MIAIDHSGKLVTVSVLGDDAEALDWLELERK